MLGSLEFGSEFWENARSTGFPIGSHRWAPMARKAPSCEVWGQSTSQTRRSTAPINVWTQEGTAELDPERTGHHEF